MRQKSYRVIRMDRQAGRAGRTRSYKEMAARGSDEKPWLWQLAYVAQAHNEVPVVQGKLSYSVPGIGPFMPPGQKLRRLGPRCGQECNFPLTLVLGALIVRLHERKR